MRRKLTKSSGKSTQVPSFLLEHQLLLGKPCKIYCTEPRRISAISLAKRVSEELGEGKGDLGTNRSLVGYSIRLEAKTSRETRLVFATTGIVMRMLEGSNDLQEITHLVLDEVHERTIDSDFLLIVLKKLLERRKDLKVVLMSATVDAERFSKYLNGAPVLTVPGRTFPVRVAYLEDAVELTGYTVDQRSQEKVTELDDDVEPEVDTSSKPELIKELRQYSARTRNTLAQMDEYRIDFDLIVQLISRIAVDPEYVPFSKAILVFLPGIAEIRTLNDMLLGDRMFAEQWLVYPLHSTIATDEQEAAFLIPPPGMRKIVLATNIAETGITIPDVTCVIDAGKHREMRFDERRQLSRLIDSFISRANAKQRRGRAGRVQEGLCFHLFTKYRHDTLASRPHTHCTRSAGQNHPCGSPGGSSLLDSAAQRGATNGDLDDRIAATVMAISRHLKTAPMRMSLPRKTSSGRRASWFPSGVSSSVDDVKARTSTRASIALRMFFADGGSNA